MEEFRMSMQGFCCFNILIDLSIRYMVVDVQGKAHL